MNNIKMTRVVECSPWHDSCGFVYPLHDASLRSYVRYKFGFEINEYKIVAQAMGYYQGPHNACSPC